MSMVGTSRLLRHAIQPGPAVLVSGLLHRLPSQLLVAELYFDVPLDYSDPHGEKLRLFARAAFRYEKPIVPTFPFSEGGSTSNGGVGTAISNNTPKVYKNSLQELRDLFTKPWLVYLEGGPGSGNREPQDYAFTRTMLSRGYQLLFLDYRGTGMSSAICAETLKRRGGPDAQAAYLRKFRADSIVRDLEAVRKCLTEDQPASKKRWSLLGQSFGGFVSLTYLSFYSDGLREVFLTGGMAPLGKTADDVYRATYRKAVERNRAYFGKFPEDADALQRISQHLYSQPDHRLPLPSGGFLTFKRVLTFGYMFGFHGGVDATHTLLLRMRHDIERVGVLTRPTLVQVEQFFPLDVMPLYAILHEPIYCFKKGVSSRWAAQRVGVGAGTDLVSQGDEETKHEFQQFSWLADDVVAPERQQIGNSILLSSEMIYPFMFDTYPELMEMKEAAELVAAYDDWEELYDEDQLKMNRVPVYAATFIDDLYVDYGIAKETAGKIRNIKVYETNGLYHNAIRARTDEVLTQLFRLRDDTMD
ncbi:hypothetical protein HMPREF1624_03231 [Sporothrix schenckii ATCC 58251]|uniref:AB hydrolase-1 domain-containing protein n=1 Tax=Sporothrix schenckii (strain ATCC 58251 / de Perez 2211183) TaxID=1391915 RepID=U7PZF3_SPOS1|nr:hypothetical protein HMPREF1624_03231 [Sporothrix schenckii ATCC 58251]